MCKLSSPRCRSPAPPGADCTFPTRAWRGTWVRLLVLPGAWFPAGSLAASPRHFTSLLAFWEREAEGDDKS